MVNEGRTSKDYGKEHLLLRMQSKGYAGYAGDAEMREQWVSLTGKSHR